MKNLLNKNKLGIERGMLGAAAILLMTLVSSAVFAFENKANCVDKYAFVNKRFACFEKHVIDKKDYRQLRSELTDYINEKKAAGEIDVVSIFFRDLEAGPTMGINERVDFAPASLLKLPVALTLMQLYEEGEINMEEKKHTFSENEHWYQRLDKAGHEIRPNQVYSLEELISKSLANSDNVATKLLTEYLASIDGGRNLLSKVYRDLGIIENDDITAAGVNTKGYSTIFRMLYNSSLLAPTPSEKILKILSQSMPLGGLRDGVPKEIKLAHKYGERIIKENEYQLHDCGIAYYPHNPYLLCIMTRGRDLNELHKIIAEISRRVYREFDSRKLGG